MPWQVLLNGWPALMAAALLLSLGIIRRSVWLSTLGAMLAVPPLLRLGWFAWFALASNWLSVVLVWRRHRVAATVLAAPFLIFLLHLAFIVIRANQNL